MRKTWMIASGKGGVGKSTLAAGLAVALAKAEQKTVLVDMDMGLRSLDIHLGMENSIVYDVMDYIHGDCKLPQAVLTHLTLPQLGLLPASQLGSAKEIGEEQMKHIFKKLAKQYDYVIADAPAGLERSVEKLLEGTENMLLVVTPDDVSIRDAERMVSLCRARQKPTPMLIVNRVIPALVQSGDMYTPQVVADTLDIPLLGYVPDDTEVLRALSKHKTVMDTDCPSRHAMDRIARRLMGFMVPMQDVAAIRTKKSWLQKRRERRGETR